MPAKEGKFFLEVDCADLDRVVEEEFLTFEAKQMTHSNKMLETIKEEGGDCLEEHPSRNELETVRDPSTMQIHSEDSQDEGLYGHSTLELPNSPIEEDRNESECTMLEETPIINGNLQRTLSCRSMEEP